ncbi:MAG: PAS domain S-box protein [Accumulibacter sp.]|jgi:two-component system sensor histidine kinase/response regulator|uniref:PAS domain S-box protein n=1 Tax=Accumulibacter sp. TaxID=2053492 RepID=UPI002FC2B129
MKPPIDSDPSDRMERRTAPGEQPARMQSSLDWVLEAAGIGVWEYNHVADCCIWNTHLRALLGYRIDQVPTSLGAWLDLIHPDDKPEVLARVEATLLATGTRLYEAEYRLRTADGGWIWFNARGRVVRRDEAGRPLLTAGTMIDISERKHTELLLQIQHEFSGMLAAAPNRERLLPAILDSALRLPELDGGGLYWREPDGGYRLTVERGLSETFFAQVRHLAADSPQAEVIRQGHLRCSCAPPQEYCTDSSLVGEPGLVEEGIVSLVVLPIHVDDEPVACLNLASKQVGAVRPLTVTALETLARQFTLALERLRGQEKAANHRYDLEGLFGAIADYVFVLDTEGRILYYNAAVAEGLGYGDARLGQPVSAVHPPELLHECRRMVAEILAGTRAHCSLPLQKADGTLIPVDTRVVTGRWNGQPALVGVSRDITESVRQQKALQRGEALLRATLDSTADGILVIGDDGAVLNANRRFQKLWRIPNELMAAGQDERLLGHVLDQVSDPEAFLRDVQRLYRTDESRWDILEFKDGRIFERFTRAFPLDDRQARLWSFRDVSERNRAQRALEDERAQLQTLIRTIPDLVWLKDPEGVYLACNPAFERLYFAPEARIVGRTDYDFVDPELADFFRANDRAAVAAGGPRINEEWLTFAADGRRGLFETIKTPMHASDGRLIGVLGIAHDITVMRATQDALREREELYRTIVNEAGEAIDLVDAQTLRFVEVGGAACRMLGYSREELLGLSLVAIQADRGEDEIRALCARLLAVGGATFDARHRCKDGRILDTQVTVRAIHLHGRDYFLGIWHDISEQKRAETALRETTMFLRESQAIARAGGWKANPVTDTLMWTEEVFRLVEHPLDQPPATLEEGLRYYAPEYQAVVRQNLQETWERGTPFCLECGMIAASGRRFWAELRCVGRIEHQGETYMTGTFQDITERKQVAAELEQHRYHLEELVAARTAELEAANRQLLISDMRLKALFEMSQQADRMNERELLQRGIEEAVRLTGSEIGYLHLVNDDQETLQLYTWSAATLKHCTAAYDSHYPISMAGVWADTARLRRAVVHNDYQSLPDRQGYPLGHAHLIRHLGVPIVENGQVRVLFGVGNKPTDYDRSDEHELQLIGDDLWRIVMRRRAEAALAVAKNAAEEASRAKSTFLANMSHEIRTPLNAILGMTYLARRRASDPKLREQLDKIEGAADHLLGVINDVLDLSKIEAGRFELERSEFVLDQVFAQVLVLIGDKVRAKGLALVTDIDPVLGRLCGDSLRLGQILINFAGNAVKFTKRGSITLRARALEETATGWQVRFEVQDTGPGIEPEDQQRLFNDFEQGDSSTTRQFGGTGLGLSINRRLVQLMGGTLGIKSQPGHGSTFWFVVHLEKRVGAARTPARDESMAGALPETSAERALARHHRGARLLLAEDNPINQEVALGLLQEVGFIVDVAQHGAEAIDLARKTDYDLILMDVQMPVLDGLKATRAIRALAGREHVPILAMTANAFEEDRRRCLDAGMNDHIGKPVDPDVLFATLLKWLPDRSAPTSGSPPSTELATAPATDLPDRLAAIPGFDPRLGLERVQGRSNTYLRLLRQFAESSADDGMALRRYLAVGDHVAARRWAHSLRGAAGTLGAVRLQTLAAKLEEAFCEERSAAETGRLVAEVEAAQSALVAALRAALSAEAVVSCADPDWPRARVALAELEALLSEDDIRAGDTFRTNAPLLRAALGDETVKKLARNIDRFDFERALAVLREARAEKT